MYKLKPEEWNKKYGNQLFNYALKKISDEELAKDLVQDTFLAAMECMDRFEYRSSEKTWLLGILKNKIFLVYRKRLKRPLILTDFQNTGSWEFDKNSFVDPDFNLGADAVEKKEFQFLVHQFVVNLPELWQSVFTMKYTDDQHRDDICARLNITPSYYWVICHRLKANLKIQFEIHSYDRWY